MSMKDLEAGLALISKNPSESDFEGPKTDALIELAEKKLGQVFPATYREFLKKLGCGDVCGEEFYGVIDENFENSAIPDAVWFTLEERKSGGLPHPYLIIGALGDGELLALDTAPAREGNEGPVLLLPSGYAQPGAVIEKLAADFGEFFLRTVSDALGTD